LSSREYSEEISDGYMIITCEGVSNSTKSGNKL
jgi:hypothetical protein